MMYQPNQGGATVAQTLKPLFQQYFSQERLEQHYPVGEMVGKGKRAHRRKRKPYQRVWTPLVTVWGMVFQRLSPGGGNDDVVSAFRAGMANDLDARDRHGVPLSQRMRSEQAAGYVQAKERVPVGMIQLRSADLQASAALAQGGAAHWHGHAVRLVDGTTYRLPARGDLPSTYGQATNQHGDSYWVTAKSVAAFCLYSRTLVGHAEGASTASEASLLRTVMEADPQRDSVYVGDIGYGHYRVVQVARACDQHVVVRLEARYARHILRSLGYAARPTSPNGGGWEIPWVWQPESDIVTEPGLPAISIPGRLMYVRVTPPGGAPIDLYLFTTLTDAHAYPLSDLVALYTARWEIEIVQPQMTKTSLFAARAGRDHITYLDTVVGDNDPVDQQLDQLPTLFKAGRRQAGLYAPAEVGH
jgi:hypothetical protein